MLIKLPEDVKRIIETLENAGYEAYAVGGCVRDSLLGRTPKDWDITTNADPLSVKGLFKRTVDTGLKHGTVTIMIGKEGYEVTTYRIDGEYTDGRHPDQVCFTPILEEDLKRRDFTINAMAYNEKNGLVDLFDGQADLENKIVRCVGEATERFGEDALRMMRAVRFAAELGFEIEEKTVAAIKELAPTIKKISAERIRVELMKTLLSDKPGDVKVFYETGLTKYFLPEFDEMMNTPQNNPHHKYCVGDHTVMVVKSIRNDSVLRVAALLHDIAKPKCISTDEEGINHFKMHPNVGAKMAEEVLRRLKFDNETIKMVINLIRWHDDRPEPNKRNVRRMANRVGESNLPFLFELNRADIAGQSDYKKAEKLKLVDTLESLFNEIMAEGDCISLKNLEINGNDVKNLGVKDGKEIGNILTALLDEVMDNPKFNKRELLLERASELIKANL